ARDAAPLPRAAEAAPQRRAAVSRRRAYARPPRAALRARPRGARAHVGRALRARGDSLRHVRARAARRAAQRRRGAHGRAGAGERSAARGPAARARPPRDAVRAVPAGERPPLGRRAVGPRPRAARQITPRSRMKTLIVGAGPGGLAAAINLAGQGHEVTVVEKEPRPGGRMRGVRFGDYEADSGPTILQLPQVLASLFARAGKRLDDYVTLAALDPNTRIHFWDGAHLDTSTDTARMREALAALDPAHPRAYDRWLA